MALPTPVAYIVQMARQKHPIASEGKKARKTKSEVKKKVLEAVEDGAVRKKRRSKSGKLARRIIVKHFKDRRDGKDVLSFRPLKRDIVAMADSSGLLMNGKGLRVPDASVYAIRGLVQSALLETLALSWEASKVAKKKVLGAAMFNFFAHVKMRPHQTPKSHLWRHTLGMEEAAHEESVAIK